MDNGKVNILIVDDRPEKVLALEAVLEDLHQNIIRAYSGREALRHLLNEDFAVVLLDVNMPGIDGFETAELIRQRRSSDHIPIIFITALGDEMHVARGYQLGAVDYITAPVVPEVLRTKVAVFVDLYNKTAQVRRQASWLQQRATQLHKLTSASLAINSALSMDKMIQVVTDTAREIIGANQAWTFAIPDPTGRHSTGLSFSEKYADWKGRELKLKPARIHGLICDANKAWRMSQRELASHPLYQAGEHGIADLPPLYGWLAAPLTGRDGRNMGFIQLSEKMDGDFTDDDEAVLVQLTQMASIAIENTLYSNAREANRLKDEFLATLSHELRTPLNAIVGWTQLLRSEKDASEVEHGLEVIDRNVKAQVKLIEDLLDVSRIATGKLRLAARPVALGPIVEAAIDAVRVAADARQIQIESDLLASDCCVSGDPDRLQQVVWNLLSNAVKFTPTGGKVKVTLERVDSSLRIRVADSGRGIDPDFLPFVFDRFRQADNTSTRQHGGLGIGLTIVRHIVELHGGTVAAESLGVGHGATFTVTLPVGAIRPTAAIAAASPSPPRAQHCDAAALATLNGLHVLVVDDEADTRDVVARILRSACATVTCAPCVSDALAAVEQARPDVIVSDIAMPEQDGFALARAVQRLGATDGHGLPLVALTAYARDEDRVRAAEAGFNALVAKPVLAEELLMAIARVVAESHSRAASGEPLLK